MSKLIYFDICAVLVLLPIAPAMVRKHMNHGIVNRWFFFFIGTQIFTTIADIFAVSYDLMGPGHVTAKYITHTAYLIGRSFVTPVCISFLLARVGLWYRYRRYARALMAYFFAAVIPTIILIFVNPFKPVMFFLAEGDVYQRGPLMPIMYAISLFYAMVGYVVLARYRRVIGTGKVVCVTVVFTIALLATAFQFVFPAILVENFMMSVASLIVALGVQAPEERVYGRTALLKTSAFTEDMGMAKIMKINVSLVLISITNFETLREILGYEAITRCIDYIVESFEHTRREVNTDMEYYYLGSGDFACALKKEQGEHVLNAAHAINDKLLDDFNIDGMSVKFISNVCVAKYPEDISDHNDILPFIESLKMLEYTGEVRYAKKLFDENVYDIRRNIEAIIDRAISDENISLVYQPIYSVDKERYIAAEAFLRVHDPYYGDIPPELFIKEAERCGAIHGITTYLFEEICKFISGPEFMQLNLEWIELNLSPTQCMWKDLVSVVMSLIKSYGIRPEEISFNIVDDENARYFPALNENMEAFKNAGIKLYMDDFGAGVFEIERIAKLPLTGIKFDKELVKMGVATDNILVLENSVNMIKDMGLEVVAVGIENLSLRRRLVEMGCTTQQGYYYSKPKDKRELIRFLMGIPGMML